MLFRRDPRFVDFCAKLGLCDYWAASECWPDDADALDAAYDFRARVRVVAKRANAAQRVGGAVSR